MKKILSSVILFCIFIIACKKNENYFRAPGNSNTLISLITGRVSDLNNLPVDNALVSAGTITTTTDINGIFFLKNVKLSSDAVFLTVSKAGYFHGSRTFFVNPNPVNITNRFADRRTSSSHNNSINYVNVKLIPKIVSGNFSASLGGTIQVSGGGTVDIGAGSVVNASTGIVYSGNVSVSAFYLNPADSRFNDYMPGDLRGVTINNEERILQSFGMLAIEMNDANGEKLQLAPSKTATITLPISADLQAMAPASIPLWYFDETKGIWKEEGSATKQNNKYSGTVTHFSFWNCDLPAKYVKLDVTFNDQKRIALANSFVTITSTVYGTRGGYTDNQGTVSGLIPANETLVLKLFNQCNEIIYQKNTGPFSADINLGIIIVANPASQLNITVTGNVVTCNNSPVTNGYVLVSNGANYFNAPVTNGNFTITFPVCIGTNNPVTLFATDIENSRQSEAQIININNGNQNIGQITACIDFSNL